MTAYGNRRIDPRNNTEYPNTSQDPELHTIAEFEEFPGQYGFQLRFRPKSGTLTITEDTGGTAYNLVTTTPLTGQIQVDYTTGYCFANIADDGQLAFCQFDGLGANLSVENVTAMASSGPATTKGDIAVYNGAALARLGSSSDGALIIDNAAASIGRKALPVGADYTVLHSLSSDSNKIKYGLITSFPKELFYPLNRDIQGILPTIDSGDTAHDWSISPGWCWDATFTKVIYLSSALIKQLDASWAVGTNAGGLDTGSSAANTTYFIWAILRSDTGVVDVLFSTSSSAPTMPANYDYKRLIGVFKTQSGVASNIQVINEIWGNQIKSRISSVANQVSVTNLSTSRVTYPLLDVPAASGITALINMDCAKAATIVAVLVTALDETDVAPVVDSIFTIQSSAPGGTTGNGNSSAYPVKLNSSAQFGARSTAASTVFYVNTAAYFYNRSI